MTGKLRRRTRAGSIAFLILAVLIAWLGLQWLGAAVSGNVHFDGAMNLEVARSLAAGEGPRRLYDGRELFPYEIQTKEPYVVLAAGIYSIAGIGPFQSQIPNLIFLLFACAVVATFIRRQLGVPAGSVAVVALLAAPAGVALGLHGLGELPAFAFALASLAIAARGNMRPRISSFLTWSMASGVFAGLALATKTVAAIMFAACAIVVAFNALASADPTARHRMVALATAIVGFTLGGLLPLVLVESWKLLSLGLEAYSAWWHTELLSIGYQAGISDQQDAAGLGKALKHFGILAGALSMNGPMLALALIAGFGSATVAACQSSTPRPIRMFLFGLLLIVVIYFLWWLFLTPTEKAWLRRIFIGLTALSMAGGIACFALFPNNHGSPSTRPAWMYALAGAALLPLLGFVWQASASRPSFAPDAELRRTIELARAVGALPHDALIVAYGWYSAPAVALYSGRQFIDYTDWPVSRMVDSPAYLITDRYNEIVGADEALMARYVTTEVGTVRPDGQLFAIDFASLLPDGWPRQVVFMDTPAQAEAAGVEAFDPTLDGHWVESDSLFWLPADRPASVFSMEAYMPPQDFYRLPEPQSGTLYIEGCEPLEFAFGGEGWETFRWELSCTPTAEPASPRMVRLLLSNTFDMPKTHDRQRALVIKTMRFLQEDTTALR